MKPDFSYRLRQKVENYIEENELIRHGDSVIIGLSGGADSVCLFLLLNELQKKYDIKLYAVHINHSIRGKSADDDEFFSKEICSKYNIEYKSYKIDVPAISNEEGTTLEEAGRNVRYACFEKYAYEIAQQSETPVKIAVAHHMDDQAETVIFNLLRGAGLKGIGGMRPKSIKKGANSQLNIIRPLLCVTKEDILKYLECNNQDYRVDETNTDNDYSRNLIRNEIIPKLELLQPKAAEHISSLSNEARDVTDYIDEEINNLFSKAVLVYTDENGDKSYRLNVKTLCNEKEIIVKQVIIYTLKQLIERYKDITRIHIDDVYSLFSKGKGKHIILPYNLVAKKEKEYVEIKKNR